MAMTKDEALKAFTKAARPVASERDWEGVTIVSAGRPQITYGNFVTRMVLRAIEIPTSLLRGFTRRR